MTTYKSTDALPILVLLCELDILGVVVVAAFGGILLLRSTVIVVVNV